MTMTNNNYIFEIHNDFGGAQKEKDVEPQILYVSDSLSGFRKDKIIILLKLRKTDVGLLKVI